MHFDASPKLKAQVESRLRQDPQVIRWTTLKLGEKLEDIALDLTNKTVGEYIATTKFTVYLSLPSS